MSANINSDINAEAGSLNTGNVPAAPEGERCQSLRCKGMYLNFGLGQTEHVAGDGNFWCAKTQRIFGPDDQLVGDGVCRHSGRGCYNGG